MGRATPGVIIVTRHGARLDAEDHSWQQNSETPYDSPLSYGGWTQTRALGARIASLLRQRDVALNEEAIAANKMRASDDIDVETATTGQAEVPITTSKRRKHKVIIHSSPFLRCVQSSIAICAGMAQYQGNLARFEAVSNAKPSKPAGRTAPSRSKTLDPQGVQSRYGSKPPTSNPESSAESSKEDEVRSKFMKPILRIDACLGEWLSQDYFEHIKPPPGSDVMVAGAKSELSREISPLQGASTPPPETAIPEPPPLDLNSRAADGTNGTVSTTEVSDALSGENSSTSGTSSQKIGNKGEGKRVVKAHQDSLPKGYTPPVPTYAVSTHAPIPAGFVAHARDACLQIDLPWDSMSPPQSWGDGGELEEEWSSMHRRFRKALMEMITWYKSNGPYLDPQADASESGKDETMDDDEDIVLVIVTHGAGCNALIGALTNQPVLLDVGMGSLTMAVHKELLPSPSSSNLSRMTSTSSTNPSHRGSSSSRRRSSIDTSQASEYEMKLVASTDHLRAGADPLKIPQLQSPTLSSIPERSRHNDTWSPPSSGASSPKGSRNSSLGSIRRARATTFGGNRSMSENLPSPTSSGLWGSRQPSASNSPQLTIYEESELETVDDGKPRQNSDIIPPPRRSSSNSKGLWGSAPRKEPVRRWTINEND